MNKMKTNTSITVKVYYVILGWMCVGCKESFGVLCLFVCLFVSLDINTNLIVVCVSRFLF